MKMNRGSILAASISLCCFSSVLQAAGFGIAENSAVGVGNAFAGSAAGGTGDSSTVWFNPAGMELLGDHTQVTSAVHVVSTTFEYGDKGSSGPLGPISGKNDDAGGIAAVPNLYFTKPIGERMHFGLGVNGPFGAAVKYDEGWYGRYQSTDTEMLTVNVNPSLSYRVSDKLSVGGGVSAQYVDVTFAQSIQSGAACIKAATQAGSSALVGACNAAYPTISDSAKDSSGVVKGDGYAFGYNFGLLYEPSKRTRLGFSYRSAIQHDVEGTIDFTINDSMPEPIKTALTARSEDVTASVKVPATASVSVAFDASEKLELLADLSWTEWSNFQELVIKSKATGLPVSTVHENWEDVWRISVGSNYKFNDKLTLRAGLAFDEEPIPSAKYRTTRIPGNDRKWVSVGAGYQLNKKLSMDVGFAHLIIDDTPINHTDENGYTTKGVYDSNADILSAQVNYKF